MTKVSIIIPCHNEAGSVRTVLEGVLRHVPGAEVIVVDDGSADDTARVAGEVPGVTVVRLEANSGKGAALQRGVRAAHGDTLVFMDGDGQDDPEDVKLLLAEIEAGRAFVNGSKFIGAIEAGGISRPNFWGNRFMSALINLLFRAHVTDSQSGFRAISRQVFEDLQPRAAQYEIETEVLCRALKAGVAVAEVPVTRKARTAGATGFRRVRNGLRILRTIFKERFTSAPRKQR